MVGSTMSISGPNFVLNTVVGRELKEFADELEGSKDFNADLHKLIVKTIKEHERILFNGNGYDSAWVEEAEKKRPLQSQNNSGLSPLLPFG